jgi:hypothetical protein
MTAKRLDLTKASRKELVARYRKLNEEPVHPGDLAFQRQEVRDELRHREIRAYTKAMFWMTVAITLATIGNVILWALR